MSGRKPKWDYLHIAQRYSMFYRPGQHEMLADEVKRDITRHRRLFEQLASFDPLETAYFRLREISEGRLDAKEFLARQSSRPAVPLLRNFQADPRYTAALPRWYLTVLRSWLSRIDRRRRRKDLTQRDRSAASRRDNEVSLSLYLMSNCLQDERFNWAARRVKTIWRMGKGKRRSPLHWYQWLYAQQERAVEQLLPEPTERARRMASRRNWYEGFGRHFSAPYDERDVNDDTDGVYDLPISDYRYHLKQLVLLAGGDPTDDSWADWTESILWDLRPRLGVGGWGNGEVDMAWLRDSFLGVVLVGGKRHCPGAPTVDLAIDAIDGPLGRMTQLNIRVPSRWTSFAGFPDGQRRQLVQAALRVWGSYREPLTHTQRVEYLRGVSTSARSKSPLEELWDSREGELSRLPKDQQEGIERMTVRRAADRLRKRQTRAKNRL